MQSFINYSETIQMKKIKSIKQLKAEKRHLEQQQQLLEFKIRNSWGELRESLKPGHLAKETYNKVLSGRQDAMLNGDSILKCTVSYGASLLAQKIMDRGGIKLGKLFRK
jgi:hypothetical protein